MRAGAPAASAPATSTPTTPTTRIGRARRGSRDLLHARVERDRDPAQRGGGDRGGDHDRPDVPALARRRAEVS